MKRTCKECGNEFDITQSEIRFYKSKHLALPKRCKDCRARKKQQSDGENRKTHFSANVNAGKQGIESSKSWNNKESKAAGSSICSKENIQGKQEAAVKDHGKQKDVSVSQTPAAPQQKTDKGRKLTWILVLCIAAVLAITGLLYLWISGSQDGQDADSSSYDMDYMGEDVEKAGREPSYAAGSASAQYAEELYPEEDEWQADDLSDETDAEPADGTEYDVQEEAEDDLAENARAWSEDEYTYDDAKQVYFRSEKLLNQHYQKHGIAMGFDSAEEYEAAAAAVVNNPDALHKLEAEDGDDIYYVESTNEFVVVSTDGYIRTYFNPDKGIDYYNRQ